MEDHRRRAVPGLDPEAIIIPSYAGDLTPQDFFDHPLLGSVEAVRNRRVYKGPLFTLTPDAPEIYLTAIWTARLLHGDDVAPDFADEMLKAYRTAYGKDLTEAQADRILAVGENDGSTDYSALFD